MSFIFFYPRIRPLDDDGNPMPGCYLQFYESATTTPTPVYADGDLDTALTNPVVANAAGVFPAIYGDPSVVYRMQLYTAEGVLVSDDDPIHPHSSVPPGTIVMFDGTAEDRDAAYPPALWDLCDGDNSTPDARDRSPVGVSNTKAIGTTGGDASGTTSEAGAHDHDGAVSETTLDATNMPKHYHRLWAWVGGGSDGEHECASRPGGAGIGGQRADQPSGGSFAYARYANTSDNSNQLVEDSGSDTVAGHDHDISEDGAHTHTVDTVAPYFTVWFLKRKSS